MQRHMFSLLELFFLYFFLSDEMLSTSTFRQTTMTKIRKDFYCSYPPVVKRSTVVSVTECVSLCLHIPGCFYINTLNLDSGDVLCDLTDTSATQSSIAPIRDGSGWNYYSSF